MLYFLYGCCLSFVRNNFLCHHFRFGCLLRNFARALMDWFTILSGIFALGLFIYLVIALLKPEIFP